MTKFLLPLGFLFFLWACKTKDISAPAESPSQLVIPGQAFDMPGLDRTRLIRIYLPPGYDQSTERYPVLYLHDGQNLFEDSTSYVGEMHVDERLDELADAEGFKVIAVGIDNGQERRLNEMSPWDHDKYGSGEGKVYMDFIVHTVKPYIDSLYRTKADRENTGIMGASMGGFISHYAIGAYPEVFAKAGIFSPAYWYADEVYDYVRGHPLDGDAKLYMLVGDREGDGMVEGAQKMFNILTDMEHPESKKYLLIDPEGQHNEAFWESHFLPAVRWLFDL